MTISANTKFFFISILLTSLLGCAQFGPDLMKKGRNEYNKVLAQTEDEEILLNLVRLRYADNPSFLKVNSVSTAFNWKEGYGFDASFFKGVQDGKNNIGIRGNTEYIEKPTITYSPLSGSEYVKNFLTPVNSDLILLLARSGWSLDRVVRLTVNRINKIENAPTASGPTPKSRPVFKEFIKLSRKLNSLNQNSKISFGYQMEGNPNKTALLIKKKYQSDKEVLDLKEMLKINTSNTIIPIANYVEMADEAYSNDINLESRSLAGILFFLSHGVQIPLDDLEQGRVTQTKDIDGKNFNWAEVLNDLFTVYTSKEPPKDATIAVEYRNNWFYIKDNDMDTKYTLMLLNQISSLQSGNIDKPGPLLTLPVSGN